jgi:hypothetical protein
MTKVDIAEIIKSFKPWYTGEVRNSKRLVAYLNDNGGDFEYHAQGVDIQGCGIAIECKKELKNRNHDLPRSTQLYRDFSALPSGTRTFVVMFGDAKQPLLPELEGCYAAFGFSPEIIVLGETLDGGSVLSRGPVGPKPIRSREILETALGVRSSRKSTGRTVGILDASIKSWIQ